MTAILWSIAGVFWMLSAGLQFYAGNNNLGIMNAGVSCLQFTIAAMHYSGNA